MKLSKRTSPAAELAPLTFRRTYAVAAPSRPAVEKLVTVEAGKFPTLVECVPRLDQVEPSVLYSSTWLVKPPLLGRAVT